MPHLAPLNWIFLPSLFYFSSMMLMSMFWWNQLPIFPSMSLKSSYNLNMWKW